MKFAEARKEMVYSQLTPRGITDKNVIRAFLKVPRELFVPYGERSFAYEDGPLSIGAGQTISQPYIVALMTQSLKLKRDEKVLEIGTGSGYQAAILAEMGCLVYSVERYSSLAEKAGTILRELGYEVKIKVGDGTLGWVEFSPFDKIIVTAGGPRIPDSLFAQLKDKGRMVIPVGDLYYQELTLVTRLKGRRKTESLGGCQFVKLHGREGWPEDLR
ncbi:MAG TPA: protein-L-isoaspartate(D-aspartate) O-methyltransferase [bacterium]|jgi:protein-L-isoaspartate(D-aspartate) O-methyltransferase|nr:protein-L-isoaspartate(D-aspartate) O-methyltransferase [bacterium]